MTNQPSISKDASGSNETNLQTDYLLAIDTLLELNQNLIKIPAINDSLNQIRLKTDQFKIVVPVIGKFSSGKR